MGGVLPSSVSYLVLCTSPLPSGALTADPVRYLFAAVLAVLLAAPALAQFRVVSSVPADGAVGVSTTAPIRLTLSQEVDPGHFPVLVSFPLDSIQVGDPIVTLDLLNVDYPVVTRTADTRFVHLVLGDPAAATPLERPYAFSYTTAAQAGGFTVTGRVTATTGSADATLVVLAGLGTDGSVSLADATVLSGTAGTYSLGPVPIALYTVAAVRLPNEATGRTFAYGFYDSNADGTPDPVILPFNVNVTISEPAPVTARVRYDDAAAEAMGQAPDAEFYAIPETPVDTLGQSPLWSYVFYSGEQDSTITVLGTPLFPLAVTTSGSPEALGPVLPEWVDSDVAVASAEAAGGAAFRAAFGDETEITARGGLYGDVPTNATPAWRITYRAGAADSLVAYVHMGTGAIITVTTTATTPAPTDLQFALEAPAPNPAAGRVALAYTLAAEARVQLRVLDPLGREVAVLEDGPHAVGRHTATWAPPTGLASGVYLVRLEAGGQVAVRTFTLAR